MTSTPTTPSPAPAPPATGLFAQSTLLTGVLVGAAIVAVDFAGDCLGEILSDTNSRDTLAILSAELFTPTVRELWVRGYLFLAGFFLAVVAARQRSAAYARYVHLALHDTLTHLPNRDHFLKRVHDEVAYARRHHSSVGLFLIGLDHFKLINDMLGHHGGDQLLIAVAQRLRDSSAKAACVARLCSDHFAVLTRLPETVEHAHAVARDIQAAITMPYLVDGKDIFMTASVGVTIFPDDGAEADKMLHRADHAMCQAKKAGRGNVCFYSSDLEHRAAQRVQIEIGLRHALERGEFFLQYQPIVNPNSGAIRGMEALLRWKRADGTIVPPLDFIPAAENTGLIVPIGAWVIERACEDMRRWYDAGHTHVSVAVNVSNRQLKHRDFVHVVQSILQHTRLPPTSLELEITESMLVHDFESTLKTLTQLRDLGIRFAIDDFGTGYSSMSYLGRLPVDRLKIDRSFVGDLSPRSGNEAIVKAVMALANELRIGVVAEGVETIEQLEFLRAQGCTAIQGYLFSRPVAHDAGSKLLRSGLPAPATARAS